MKRPRRPLKAMFAELLAGSPARREKLLARLTAEEAAELYYDWSLWARPDQIAPEGDWVYWLILAGRGAGKTRAGAETARAWARAYPIVNLIGATRQDAREIMVMGESGLLAISPPEERPRFVRGADRLEWPNGAISQIFSAEEPDRLRGKQHMKLWLDELAAWRDPDAFDQAMLGLRLGDKPQAVITTTPRPTKLIKQLIDSPDAVRLSRLDLRQLQVSGRRVPDANRLPVRRPRHRAPGALRRDRRGGGGRLVDAGADRPPAATQGYARRPITSRSSSASIRRRARAQRPTNAASSPSGARRAASSMCSPISPARARRRANGRRAW